ncbi:growth-regulating factor 4-like isoform X1 [Andrographis paniculata]|nr:growth-regulating factor 4-like isoform X1 [Andrographis paniculata]
MAVSGKNLFTATQWEELERQQMIHKYMMASVPVPAHLLFANGNTATSSSSSSLSLPYFHRPVGVPQSGGSTVSGGSGLDLRFSSNGSDPEPWRCRRTDGKKWRCSRDVAPDQKYCDRHAHKSRPRSRKPVEHLSANPNVAGAGAAINVQTEQSQSRFVRGGAGNTAGRQQWQQLIQAPAGSEVRNKDEDRRRFENSGLHHLAGDDGFDGIAGGGKGLFLPPSLSNRFSPSSLTLSISGDGDAAGDSGIGAAAAVMNDGDGVLKVPPWMNPWVHPGGPLGEALRVGGNANVTRGGSNLASPHSSKSSCEDGGFNFIG